jgi:hypothetical protein
MGFILICLFYFIYQLFPLFNCLIIYILESELNDCHAKLNFQKTEIVLSKNKQEEQDFLIKKLLQEIERLKNNKKLEEKNGELEIENNNNQNENLKDLNKKTQCISKTISPLSSSDNSLSNSESSSNNFLSFSRNSEFSSNSSESFSNNSEFCLNSSESSINSPHSFHLLNFDRNPGFPNPSSSYVVIGFFFLQNFFFRLFN